MRLPLLMLLSLMICLMLPAFMLSQEAESDDDTDPIESEPIIEEPEPPQPPVQAEPEPAPEPAPVTTRNSTPAPPAPKPEEEAASDEDDIFGDDAAFENFSDSNSLDSLEDEAEATQESDDDGPETGKAKVESKFKMRVGAEFGANLITGNMAKYSNGAGYLGYLTFRTNLPFIPLPKLEVEAQIGYYNYKLNDPVLEGEDLATTIHNFPFNINALLMLFHETDWNIAIKLGYTANILGINMNDKTLFTLMSAINTGVKLETMIFDKLSASFAYSPVILFDPQNMKLFHQFNFGVYFRL